MNKWQTYLTDILDVHGFLGLRNVAHNAYVQWIDNLAVWGDKAFLQGASLLDVEKPCCQFRCAISLPVHEKATAVSMNKGPDSSQGLENNFLHVDAFLHILDQLKKDITLIIIPGLCS